MLSAYNKTGKLGARNKYPLKLRAPREMGLTFSPLFIILTMGAVASAGAIYDKHERNKGR